MKFVKIFLILVTTIPLFGAGAGITFTLENGQITGTTPKYYEFDIYVAATASTKIGACGAYVNYNTTGFGQSVVANNKITATRGSLVSNGMVYSGPALNDNTASCFGITIDYTPGEPQYGSDLGTTPQQWAHVKIEIANPNTTAGLSFNAPLMGVGSCKQSNNAYYNPVVAVDIDDSSLPVQFTGISASLQEGIGVNLSWSTESELNTSGFHVWRAETREGPYVRISSALIPGAGNSSSRREYAYTDPTIRPGKEYWYKIEEIATDGTSTFYGPLRVETSSFPPTAYALSEVYPNPFNPMASFYYELPKSEQVVIAVYSLIGQKIATLVDGVKEVGRHEASWDGCDATGKPVPSGIYFLRFDAGTHRQVRKMTLLR